MEYQLLWLLLPAAAASGWFAASSGRRPYGKKQDSNRVSLPPAYVRGLKEIIDRQHLKAVDTFIELSKINPDTVDTHIILGNLFRQRGEIEKAIVTHQNVIKKPSLNTYYRASAIFELGRDYFHAGLLDRAEELFVKVISFGISDIESNAYRELITLYEREKAWNSAIQIAEKLQKIAPHKGYTTRIAHYYCELAEISFSQSQHAEAHKLLRKAEKLNKNLLRIDILYGDMAASRGQAEDVLKALQYYVCAFNKFPDFGRLILPRIEKLLEETHTADALKCVRNLNPSIVSVSYLRTYLMFLLKTNALEKIEEFFSRLRKNGNIPLPVLTMMLQYRLNQSHVEDQALIKEIISSLQSHNNARYTYQCSHCGFQSGENYWLCPSCHYWGMITPCDTVSLKLSLS